MSAGGNDGAHHLGRLRLAKVQPHLDCIDIFGVSLYVRNFFRIFFSSQT
jgi:hypothetical protein